MNRSVKVCWYCPTNLDSDQFQGSTITYCLLSPILGVLEWDFPCGVSQFWKTLGLNCLFLINLVPICCGQDNLLGGQFWAMGRLNLLGGQINLLGGQMPTQLTCYLPPWPYLIASSFFSKLVRQKKVNRVSKIRVCMWVGYVLKEFFVTFPWWQCEK